MTAQVASSVPSGLNAMLATDSVWPVSVCFTFPDSKSQSRTGPFQKATASVLPSELKARFITTGVGAPSVRTFAPLAASQTHTDDPTPATRNLPSGLKARRRPFA